ncbi:MAG: hypothetical protein IKY10_00765 [Clostridia bacterium]|nr:hypothetical protein [Clostridia bacterium]
MLKKNSSISINILSAFIILISLLLCVVGDANAWFTSQHKEGVQIIVSVGDLKLNLYQKISASVTNQVYTYEDNNKEGATDKKYVSLSKKIVPDEQVDLELILKNEDKGSSAMYLRFKFELFARGENEDKLIQTKLVGTDSHFKYKEIEQNNEDSGYYYYKTATSGTSKNAKFEQNDAGISLMTDFVVEYSSLLNGENLINISSESLYIKLTIDASITDWLNQVSW